MGQEIGRGDSFRYDKMVEKSLRDVVKQAIEEAINKGLIADHHFYITFSTKHEGIEIPEYLKGKYPREMTIVLQHQFHDLKLENNKFSVVLSFNGAPERLVIPLEAITIFADPSVNFALQFQSLADLEEEFEFDEQKMEKEVNKEHDNKKGEVISLDTFRKKPEKGDNVGKNDKGEKVEKSDKVEKKPRKSKKDDKKDEKSDEDKGE